MSRTSEDLVDLVAFLSVTWHRGHVCQVPDWADPGRDRPRRFQHTERQLVNQVLGRQSTRAVWSNSLSIQDGTFTVSFTVRMPVVEHGKNHVFRVSLPFLWS